jgi:hypothetical protein
MGERCYNNDSSYSLIGLGESEARHPAWYPWSTLAAFLLLHATNLCIYSPHVDVQSLATIVSEYHAAVWEDYQSEPKTCSRLQTQESAPVCLHCSGESRVGMCGLHHCIATSLWFNIALLTHE